MVLVEAVCGNPINSPSLKSDLLWPRHVEKQLCASYILVRRVIQSGERDFLDKVQIRMIKMMHGIRGSYRNKLRKSGMTTKRLR